MRFEWKVRFVNNIESNGIDCWFSVQKLGDSFKLYKIVPQFPADENGVITNSETPEYYILFEGNAKPYDKAGDLWGCSNYGDFEEDRSPGFIRVFKTLEEAKNRAVLQYVAIESIIKAYFPEDANENN